MSDDSETESEDADPKSLIDQEDFIEGQEKQLDQVHAEKENNAIKLVSSLREINEEFAQIKEALEKETTISREVAAFLKELLPQVGMSYKLDPSLFPGLGNEVKLVMLTPQCIFFLTFQDGSTVARTFDNITPESMMKILEEILPSIMDNLKEKREKIAMRSIGMYRVAAQIRDMSSSSKAATERARVADKPPVISEHPSEG